MLGVNDFTCLFSVDPIIFSLLISFATMDQGFYLASMKLCDSHPTLSNDTKSKLPNSGLGIRVKWHITSPRLSYLPQSMHQHPPSGFQNGSLTPTCCSSVMPSMTHLKTMHFVFFLPETLLEKAHSLSSIRSFSSEALPFPHT